MMNTAMTHIREFLARFRAADDAVAAVEFALVLPLLLLLYFGSIEASSLYIADRRVNTISATIGDLVSQWDDGDGEMSRDRFDDYLAASISLIYPMSTTGLEIVVTCVQVLSDGTTKVVWSEPYNGGTARVANSSYTLTPQMNQAARGGYIIASETSYSYLPLLGVVFETEVNLYHENLYLPRFGGLIEIAAS